MSLPTIDPYAFSAQFRTTLIFPIAYMSVFSYNIAQILRLNEEMMRLDSNLDAIVAAVKNNPIGPLIVASPIGPTLYYKRTVLGRMWSLFYSVASIFKGEEFRNKKLVAAIEKTQLLYNQCCLETEADLRKFRTMMQEVGLKIAINQSDFKKNKHQIRYWHGKISPAIKILESFKRHNQTKLLAERFAIPSFNSEKIPVDLLNIECQTVVEIPITSLLKLSQGEKLSLKEMLQLDLWIEKIDRWANRKLIDVRTFHRGLRQMLALMLDTSKLNLNGTLAQLEYELASGGENRRRCEIFKKEDIWHVAWRSGLTPGKNLEMKNFDKRECLIDGVISINFNKRIKVFGLVNQPNKVLAVGDNIPHLAIKTGKLLNSWGFEPVEIKLDPYFRFATLEFPGICLDKMPWKELSPEIKRKNIIAIALHLQWMIKQNQSPKKLKAANIFIDEDNTLKSIKAHRPEEFFDFAAIEKFCRECAGDNDDLFLLIMELSMLTKHPLAYFYSEVFKGAFKSEKSWREVQGEICLSDELYDIIDWKKASDLFNDARQVLEEYRVYDHEFSRDRNLVGNALWNVYRSSRGFCTLSSHFKEQVGEKLRKPIDFSDESADDGMANNKNFTKYLDVMNLAIKISNQ